MKSPFKALREKLKWPKPITVDLSNPFHRWKLAGVSILLLVVGLGMLIGGVQGYSYTESVGFCGSVCHSMEPQLIRYKESPHANVECTQCHVGPGVAAFVQSKIDGTNQLIGTILDNYARPIKSPVHNLRPARETCEGCHTPTSFKDNIVKTIKHYDDDKASTLVETTLILKLGGTQTSTGVSKGIHWHISSEVDYVALDDQRQVIAWVGVKQPDGSLKEYFSRDLVGMGQTAFLDKARAEGKIRRMDCIDCHNRAAHYIPYPAKSVDEAITNGLISRDLPFIRSKAVAVLSATYDSEIQAIAAIVDLGDWYKTQAASDAALQKKATQAVETLKKLYTSTNFPDMKLDWETNPNNLGHTPTAGCFRCHDDKHVSVDPRSKDETISVKCNLCHTVPIVGRGSELLLGTPVIVGDPPATHADFRWTIEHRNVTDAEKLQCYNCHGQSFCNNGVCHNLSHPTDMLFTHPTEYAKVGGQVCYTCHQNMTCSRCHPSGVFKTP